MRRSSRSSKTKTKTTTALACCTGLGLAALSNNGGGVLAFAPPLAATSAASISTGIRKRCQQSAGSTSSRSPSRLRMTDLLLSDPTAVDGLDALAAAAASTITTSTSTSARGVLSSFLGDSTFVGLPAFLGGQSNQPQMIQSLYLDYLPTDLLSTATRTLTSTATSTLLDFSDTIVDDPQVESELLTDVAHVALDLVTFASPTRALLRLSLCVGRLLAIAADWVPDHYLHPEELVFQLFMLCVSVGLLFKTAWPVLPALLHQSTNRYGEKRAYGSLFKRHGGLSWVQTKMILAGGGAEWFELGSGEVVVMSTVVDMEGEHAKYGNGKDGNGNIVVEGSDGYLYWLQKGEAELLICSGDTCLSKERAVATAFDATTTSIDEVAILGELEFARKMQDQSKAKAKAKQTSKNKKVDKNKKTKDSAVASAISAEMVSSATTNVNLKESSSSNDISQATTTTKIRAGPAGATLLRLDASRLLKLMDDDEALADGISSIVFAGMQDKLRRVMSNQEDNNTSKSKKPTNAAGKVNDGMQPLYAAYEPYEHDF